MRVNNTLMRRVQMAIDVITGRRDVTGLTQRKQNMRLPFMWPAFRDNVPQWHLIDFSSYVEEGFNLNSLVYSAIMYKYRSVSSVRMRAYKGDPDYPEPVDTDAPLASLVARPNSSQSFSEFLGLQDVYLNLSGNAYTLMVRPTEGGLPTALIPLRPDRVWIIPKAGGILGYLYLPEGKTLSEGVPILPQDMSHVKFPNPGDPLEFYGYGLSPMSPMAQSVDVDNMVTTFIKMFFQKGAVMQGLLKFNVALDAEVIPGIKKRWLDMYGSYENWAENIGVMDQGGEYQRIGMNFDEMSFETQDERNESRVLGPFGVPPQLISSRLGLKHSTYANWEEARRAYWEDTMLSELGLFEDDLRYYLRTEDGQFVALDYSRVPALRRNVGPLVDAFVKLVSVGIPKNNASVTTGLSVGEIPDGDIVYMPMGLIPVTQLQNTDVGETGDDSVSADEDTRKFLSRSTVKKRKRKRQVVIDIKKLAETRRAAHLKAIDRIARMWEPVFQDGTRRAFENDKREILARLSVVKATAKAAKTTVDWTVYNREVTDYFGEQAAKEWRSVFLPMVEGVVSDQGDRWAATLGVEFNVSNLYARDWFNKYTLNFAQPIVSTTKTLITSILEQAQTEGWAVNTMQGHLETLFDQMMDGDIPADEFAWYQDRMPPYRTEMIARTETMRASNAGSEEIFKEWGVQKHEWLSTRDDRTRPDHLSADVDGQVQLINDPFLVGGEYLMFPGDPEGSPENTINCRCTTLPVIGDDEELNTTEEVD